MASSLKEVTEYYGKLRSTATKPFIDRNGHLYEVGDYLFLENEPGSEWNNKIVKVVGFSKLKYEPDTEVVWGEIVWPKEVLEREMDRFMFSRFTDEGIRNSQWIGADALDAFISLRSIDK